jgi:hypothetical protein
LIPCLLACLLACLPAFLPFQQVQTLSPGPRVVIRNLTIKDYP